MSNGVGSVPSSQKKGNPAYAWVVAAGGFFGQLACVSALIVYGMNMTVIAGDFGVAVPSLAIGASLFGLLYAGTSVFWGNIADKIGVRAVQSIGCLGMAVLLLAASFIAQSPPVLIILYALAGIFDSCVGPGINPKLVSAWFAPNMRGKGMTVVSFGGTLAGVLVGIIGPIAIGVGGWRFCFQVIASLIFIYGIVVFLTERDEPAKIGTVPFGSPPGTPVMAVNKVAKTEEEKAAEKARTRRVLRMPITWKFGVMYIFHQFWQNSTSAFLVASVVFAGFDLVVAGLVSAINTGAMALGVLVWPAISDKVSRKMMLGIVAIGGGIFTMVIYFILGANAVVFLYAGTCLMGFFTATTPLMQATVGEMYPPDLRGSGPGMVATIALVGRFFGPLIAGWLIAAAGGDTPFFLFFCGGSCVVLGILAFIWLPNTGGKYGDPLAEEYKEQQVAKKIGTNETEAAV
jgi:sugar phosphate permease